jgi:hypothetical protein
MGSSIVSGSNAKAKKGEVVEGPAPGTLRMSTLESNAPKLENADIKQIAALPLGGRIKMDPWTDRIEISKAKSVPLLSARDKMPFEITPIFPYLTRGTTAQPAGPSKNADGQ